MIEKYWNDVTVYFVYCKLFGEKENSTLFVFSSFITSKEIYTILYNLFQKNGVIETIQVDDIGEALQFKQ